ncbi:efflux RND transporter periplasmic adaptor subunit [Zavarzinia sp. CC-PAN008]|uniref:efflux RND transporter periplasmic adaptor subunit n=1 Tax=Zavarzinia sp. CC-PAN008 TaxID=3243332 RepID=UPI003F746ADB
MTGWPVRLLIAVSTLGLLAACDQSQADIPQLPPLVRTAMVEAGPGLVRAYTGTVRARTESDLGFRVGGKITERLVDLGQTVRRGQVLARLDATDLRLQAAAADAAIASARAQAARARADETRLSGLVERGAVSAQAFDQVRAARLAADAALTAAQSQAETSRNQARYAALVADADGVVMQVMAEPGQVVTAGQPVVRLARAGAREAVVAVPETQRGSVPAQATARLYGAEDRPIAATLRELSAAADPGMRTYEARYTLADQGEAAALGATITIEVPGDPHAGETQVPIGALYDPGTGPGVWIVDAAAAKVSFRPVTVARLGEETAQVAGGLAPGEMVVALGSHLLREGEEVRLPAGAAAQAAPAVPAAAPQVAER